MMTFFDVSRINDWYNVRHVEELRPEGKCMIFPIQHVNFSKRQGGKKLLIEGL